MITEGESIQIVPKFADAPHLEFPVWATVKAVHDTSSEPVIGVCYEKDQGVGAYESLDYLIFGSSEAWAKKRADMMVKKGFMSGIWYLVLLSVTSFPKTWRAFLNEPARRRRIAAGVVAPDQPAHVQAFGLDFDELAAMDEEPVVLQIPSPPKPEPEPVKEQNAPIEWRRRAHRYTPPETQQFGSPPPFRIVSSGGGAR
jgi:hypothetical protein